MKKKEVNSPRVPIYRDTGFELYDAETAAELFSSEANPQREPGKYIYSRYRNPTVVAAEEDLLKLEMCKWALLSESGMAAIDIALSVFQHGRATRPWFFFSEIYGGTISFIDSVLRQRRGLEIFTQQPVDGRYDLDEFERLMKELKPEIVYAETISNPLLIVSDIKSIIGIASKYGAKTIIDNTFSTPFLFRPLESGADLVVHSVTKYLAGHGNISAGVICGNDDTLLTAALEYRKFTGHMMSPDDAYRLSTQLRTFRLRFVQQCENAVMLTEIFKNSGFISSVLYPGLETHRTHPEAQKTLGGKYFGAMITVDFSGNTEHEKRRRRDTFINRVSDIIKLIPTLGDPHTILLPIESVWGAKYKEPGMLRISAGIEETDTLRIQVKEALERLD